MTRTIRSVCHSLAVSKRKGPALKDQRLGSHKNRGRTLTLSLLGNNWWVPPSRSTRLSAQWSQNSPLQSR